MQTLNPSTITLLVLAPLLAWRIYVRVRRMVGRQRLSRVRPWITLIIFPMIVLLLAFTAYGHFERLLWLAGSLLVGLLLGVYGLRHTRFESTPEGRCFTHRTHTSESRSPCFSSVAFSIVWFSAMHSTVRPRTRGRSSRRARSLWPSLAFSPAITSLMPWAWCVGETVLFSRRQRVRQERRMPSFSLAPDVSPAALGAPSARRRLRRPSVSGDRGRHPRGASRPGVAWVSAAAMGLRSDFPDAPEAA